MQKKTVAIKPGEILHIIIRNRWIIIVPFCVALIVGSVLAVVLPKIYEASTLILVQAQRVPKNYVQSVVSEDIGSRLKTIQQQVMSRTNIERIIHDYKLFQDPEFDRMYLEDKIEAVRNRIKVKVTRASTFAISYKGREPQIVTNIANALATYFIDENLKIREAQAIGTSDFLDDELNTMRRRLEESEAKLSDYRTQYMGELPEQLQANLSILSRMNEQLIEKQKALREVKSALAALENQISETRHQNQTTAALNKTGDKTDGGVSGSTDLNYLRESLAALKTRYTDRHPDVLRLEGMISKLEADGKENSGENDGNNAGQIASKNPKNDFLKLQIAQREEGRRQVRNMELELNEVKKKVDVYQKRVENTPKREEELLSIQRDYDNLKGIYDSLLERRLEAEISVNMEKKQKGEQFQIIDSAKLPEKPIAPNMMMLFMGTIVAGLGFGGGIVYLLEFMRSSYNSTEDIESSLGLPVLATVPLLLEPKQIAYRRINNIMSIASIFIAMVLFAGFAAITLKGLDRTLEVVRHLI